MNIKKNILLSVLCSIPSVPMALADEAPGSYDDLLFEIQQLRAETEQLKSDITALQDGQDDIVRLDRDEDYRLSYLGIDSYLDSDEVTLLIDAPEVNKDVALLRQKQFQRRQREVTLSGNIATTIGAHSNGFGEEQDISSNIAADIELDIGAFISDNITGYTKLAASSSNSADTPGVFMDQAFVTFGNLDKAPIYGTAGRLYVPSGDFSTVLITHTLVRRIARIRANSVVAGYAGNGLYSSIFAFDGPVTKGPRSSINQWGANLQVDSSQYYNQYFDWSLGASYVNNIASARDFAPSADSSVSDTVDSYVGAYNLRGTLEVKAAQLEIEYVSSVKRFKSGTNELQYNGRGAEPKAIAYQASYNFENGVRRGFPSTIGISYQKAQEALWEDGLPRQQYGIAYKAELAQYVVAGIEYLRKHDYSRSTTGGSTINPTSGTGNIDNVVQAKIDIFY